MIELKIDMILSSMVILNVAGFVPARTRAITRAATVWAQINSVFLTPFLTRWGARRLGWLGRGLMDKTFTDEEL